MVAADQYTVAEKAEVTVGVAGQLEHVPTADLAPRVSYGGHGETVSEPADRANAIAAHHQDRLGRTQAALDGGPRSGYDVSLELFGRALPPIQRRFAVAEALSHLERLVVLGRASRNEDGRGVTYTGAQPGGRETA